VRLISIGRFSQLTRLSPKTLRPYDQTGVYLTEIQCPVT